MNWLNLRTEILHSPEFIGSDPTARGTWCAMMLWCAQQENGGVVAGASSWSDRQWQQTCGVTRQEIDAASKLLTWDGGYLRVFAYPADQEAAFVKMAVGGRNGGLRRALNIHAKKADSVAPLQSPLQAGVKAPAEAKGREEKGKGIEIQTVGAGVAAQPASAAVDPLTLTSEPPAQPAKAKRAPKQPAQTDAEWLASLAASPAYAGIDVGREHAKASEWCRVRQQTLSRQRFVNWLNRADKPLSPTNGQHRSSPGFRHTNIASSDYRGISD